MIKKEDFTGQKMLVFPQKTREQLLQNPLTSDLFITDIGYYPKASNHFRSRIDGCEENILIYCVEGRGWIEVDHSKHALQTNQYFIIPKHKAHKYSADRHKPWTIYWIHFTGRTENRFAKIYGQTITISTSKFARFEERIQLFEELMVVLEEDLSDGSLEYSSILLTQLLGSLQYISQFRKIKEVRQRDKISVAIRFMKENLDKKLSLTAIARVSGLSVSQFSLRFKKQTSQSALDYLTLLRVQRACHLLLFSSSKIKDIALELGFEDAYYFSRVFSKVMGQSPRAYRQNEKG